MELPAFWCDALVSKNQRPAAINISLFHRRRHFATKKYHRRDEPPLGVESKHPGVSILVGHKEIALLITEKLRIFTLAEPHRKMPRDLVHARQQSTDNQLNRFGR